VALPARGVLEIRSADSEHVIALYNPLALAYFSRPPNDGELAVLRALAREGRAQALGGGMLFVVARKNIAGGIDPRVREFFEQLVRENSAKFGASATVVTMQGFGGALMRSFLTGLLLLTGRRNTLQIFSSVEDACRWLAPLHDLDAADLLQAYQKATANIAR
jgi:hypothetical protein